MSLAPICLFTYNRLDETRRTLEGLQQNFLAPESELFVFSDGAKDENGIPKIQEVRDYLKTVRGFKKITIKNSKVNKGLANSIIDGVSEVINEHEKVIVLEDDLITSPNFLNFMNQSLEFYKADKRIKSINGYSIPIKNCNSEVYIQTRPFSWGWATWQDRWNRSIFDKSRLRKEVQEQPDLVGDFAKVCGQDVVKMFKDSIHNRNNSWYIRWAYDHFRSQRLSVYPARSLVENIGFNLDGTHCNGIGAYNFKMKPSNKTEFYFPPLSYPQKEITKQFLYHFSLRRKLEVRFNALKSVSGRKLLCKEIKQKLGVK